MGLLSLFRRDRPASPQQRWGTGLWRQHRDRFSRAVDRFYTTVSTLHREHGQSAAASQIEQLAQLTLVLNDLDARIEVLAEICHRAVPLDGLVFPADGRQRLGDVPEHLSRASAHIAQAAQAAAMLRARLATHPDEPAAALDGFAEAARGYVDRATDLIAEAEAGLPAELRPQPGSGD